MILQSGRHGVTGAQLEQIDGGTPRVGRRVVDQELLRRRCAERAAVIEEWHRHEVVTEERAAHPHEWQHTLPRPVLIGSDAVQAFVAQYVGHDLTPPHDVTERGVGRALHERVPLIRAIVVGQ